MLVLMLVIMLVRGGLKGGQDSIGWGMVQDALATLQYIKKKFYPPDGRFLGRFWFETFYC